MRGFLDSLATLITREQPSRLVVCLDLDWRPSWRVDLIPSYKAHRVAAPADPESDDLDAQEIPDAEEIPDELSPQVEMILEILDAYGIAPAVAMP